MNETTKEILDMFCRLSSALCTVSCFWSGIWTASCLIFQRILDRLNARHRPRIAVASLRLHFHQFHSIKRMGCLHAGGLPSPVPISMDSP
jgi:hypothetical protein